MFALLSHNTMFKFWITILLLNGLANGSLISRLVQSRLQQRQVPVISIISCNNSENLPQPQYQTSQFLPNSNYFVPTILNHASTSNAVQHSAEEDENDVDIGNRIKSPLSLASRFPIGSASIWTPFHRLTNHNGLVSNNNNNLIIKTDQAQNALHVENDAKFYLFTKDSHLVGEELKVHDKRSVNESSFSRNRPTKLIFHGLEVSAAGDWVNLMKETYLSTLDVNVIVADFSSFSLHNLLRTSLPVFTTKRLTEFISSLSSETDVPLDSFHLIARSYGCHVLGQSGKQLGGKLGRITCLEPSQKIIINGGPDYVLNKNDAQFVDVIHVNGQRFFFHGPQFGLISPMGDLDIYPNIAEKGLGCPGETLTFRRYSLRHCHIGRGVRYFIKSIKYPELYPMCECGTFEIYKAGLCNCYNRRETMKFMGENISNLTRGVFQLAPVSIQNSGLLYSQHPSQNLVYG